MIAFRATDPLMVHVINGMYFFAVEIPKMRHPPQQRAHTPRIIPMIRPTEDFFWGGGP